MGPVAASAPQVFDATTNMQQNFLDQIMAPSGIPTSAPPVAETGFMAALNDLFGGSEGAFGSLGDVAGGVGNVLGSVGGIMGAVNAGKQNKFAKTMYADQLSAYNQNAQQQANSINTYREDRQIARKSAMSPEQYAALYGSTKEYMDKNRVNVTPIG